MDFYIRSNTPLGQKFHAPSVREQGADVTKSVDLQNSPALMGYRLFIVQP